MKQLDNREIGQNIIKARLRHGIRQIDLARAAKISQTHMSNIENGYTGISLMSACRISQILGCSIDELVYGLKPTNKQNNSLEQINLKNLLDALKIVCKNN